MTSPRVTMEGMRILVVEDEVVLAGAVAEGLRRAAHAVDVVHDGAAALERAEVNDYDVVVLDRDLPVLHGDDVCRALAARDSSARVLMLTAAAAVDDRVAGLALGADDYLPKPFAFRELAARVTALGRRSRPAAPPVLRRAGIQLDPHRREVFRDGRYVPLSRKEFAVLAELLRADGVAVSAEQLIEKAWDEHADPFSHAVRMTILKLRRKLGDPPVLLTDPGVGYRIP
jgi:DNA-binding response OmpR family regulator